MRPKFVEIPNLHKATEQWFVMKALLRLLQEESVRLRPIAATLTASDTREPENDDKWRILHIDRYAGIWLHNMRTNRSARFHWRHFREFTPDPTGGCAGILVMNGQMFIKGSNLWVEGVMGQTPPEDGQ